MKSPLLKMGGVLYKVNRSGELIKMGKRRRNAGKRAVKSEVTKTFRGDRSMEAGVKRLQAKYMHVTTVQTGGTWNAPIYTVYAKDPWPRDNAGWIKARAVRITNTGVIQVKK